MEAEVLPDEPMPIPEDSMEAGVSLHPQEEASNRNAQRASELLAHGALDRELQVVILKFARSPDAFRRALLEGPIRWRRETDRDGARKTERERERENKRESKREKEAKRKIWREKGLPEA